MKRSIALLIYGGRWVVDSGIVIAEAWGIPERVGRVAEFCFNAFLQPVVPAFALVQPQQVGEGEEKQNGAFEGADAAVAGGQPKDARHREQDGQVLLQNVARDGDRLHQRRYAQHEEDVDDVATEDIAEGNRSVTESSGRHRDDQFGGARAKVSCAAAAVWRGDSVYRR